MNVSVALPAALYSMQGSRQIDALLQKEFHVNGYDLMQKAGVAAFQLLQKHWPDARRLGVVCGRGNNGGDGLIVAREAIRQGYTVRLYLHGKEDMLSPSARLALQDFLAAGGRLGSLADCLAGDLVVDALLGTGVTRPVTGQWRIVIEKIAKSNLPVFSLDIPSGLNGDTGQAMGIAVHATVTLSFLTLKSGLFTGAGRTYAGTIFFDDLGVEAGSYHSVAPVAMRSDWQHLAGQLAPRTADCHKGENGHVLLLGGDYGYAGALLLAGEAAARVGAGLVTLATRSEHAPIVVAARPELMTCAVSNGADLSTPIERANVIAIGPGLGQGSWGHSLFAAALASRVPLVVDADGLNLLAANPEKRDNWVLTPHPGEAARLLGCDTQTVMHDRLATASRLQKNYGGVIALKGSGSVVADGKTLPSICTDGNPGMASGGMGDVLTGVIAGLIAQGLTPSDAAKLGVCLHARAADRAAMADGIRGLLAGDLLLWLRRLSNPDIKNHESTNLAAS